MDTGQLDLLDNLHHSAGTAFHSLSGWATYLFVILATLQLCALVLMHFITNEESGKFFSSLGRYLIITLIFWFLLAEVNNVSFWILQGAIDLGSKVDPSISNPSPIGIVQLGARLSGTIVSAASDRGFFDNFGLTLLALVFAFFILIIMGLVAAEVAVLYGKFYILVGVSMVLVALGALEQTRPIAKNYFKALIGLGLQLLTVFVLLAVFARMSAGWAGTFYAYAQDLDKVSGIWMIPIEMLIFYMLVRTIPPFVAGLSEVQGFASKGAEAAMLAMMVSKSTAETVMKTMRGGQNVAGAVGAGAAAVAGSAGLTVLGSNNSNPSQAAANALASSSGQTNPASPTTMTNEALSKMDLSRMGAQDTPTTNQAQTSKPSMSDLLNNRFNTNKDKG